MWRAELDDHLLARVSVWWCVQISGARLRDTAADQRRVQCRPEQHGLNPLKDHDGVRVRMQGWACWGQRAV